MLDMKFLRENPDIVKENIKKKFQDRKLPLVDEVIELDEKTRKNQQEADDLRNKKNKISKQIGALMAQGKKEEAEEAKKQVAAMADEMAALDVKEQELMFARISDRILDMCRPIHMETSESKRVASGKHKHEILKEIFGKEEPSNGNG